MGNVTKAQDAKLAKGAVYQLRTDQGMDSGAPSAEAVNDMVRALESRGCALHEMRFDSYMVEAPRAFSRQDLADIRTACLGDAYGRIIPYGPNRLAGARWVKTPLSDRYHAVDAWGAGILRGVESADGLGMPRDFPGLKPAIALLDICAVEVGP